LAIEELLFFAEELSDTLSPKLADDVAAVQRGLVLYRQELVYKLTMNADFIRATVQDVTPVQVELDLLAPAKGSCTCKQDFICRHQMAVFFSAYEQVGSVSEWVTTWKNGKKPTSLVSQEIQLQKARDLLSKTKSLERSYEAWKEFAADCYKRHIIENLHIPSYFLQNKWDLLMQNIGAKAPFEQEWKAMYRFVTNFQIFLMMSETIQSASIPYATKSFLHYKSEGINERIHDAIQVITRQARPFAFDAFFEGIKKDTERLTIGVDGLEYEKVDLYRTIWSFLLKNKDWRQEELKKLEEKLSDIPKEKTNTYMIAAIHLSLLNDKDEQAVSLLSQLGPDACPYLYYWIQRLNDLDHEMRALPFIEFLNQNLKEFLKKLDNYYEAADFVRTIASPIQIFCHKTNRIDLLEKFFQISLPYSFYLYANYLLDNGQYRKWVELQIIVGLDPDRISSEVLKKIQAHDPALLLPIYHRLVEDAILLKNRQSYKKAVRYLKKLRTIYKKLKRENAWESYIDNLQSSTRRMRAFQEELQRGKLIHV
jgi:hypothetical protein